MEARPEVENTPAARRGFSGAQVALIVLVFIGVTIGATLWLARTYFFPQPFQPVQLSAQEDARLNAKLRRLDIGVAEPDAGDADSDWLRPEPYSEAGASREVRLSERELNGLLARDPQLAERVAVDLSRDLASARVLIPVDPDFPLLGGRTLRVAAGLQLAMQADRIAITLRGVSIMGIPVPSAWLGGLKNRDLVAEFGGDPGFWRSLADGIEDLRITDGQLVMQLRE
jgi:hypothetical protein